MPSVRENKLETYLLWRKRILLYEAFEPMPEAQGILVQAMYVLFERPYKLSNLRVIITRDTIDAAWKE